MRLLFIDATPDFTPTRKDKRACGGILTSLTIIPQHLAGKGHEVTVKSSWDKEVTVNGVRYIPIHSKTEIPKWDVTILNRNGVYNELVEYSHSIGAKVVWWLHDIVDFRYLRDAAYRRVDRIIALSQYCRTSFADFYDIKKEKFAIIPNGVDKSVFYPGEYNERKKQKLLMASALIKGFTPVYDTWRNVKRQFPEANLAIYGSQGLHGLRNSDTQQAFLKEIESEGASIQRPISQKILADKMREAWILLMPNSYPEICSNLLLQARACGLPVVSSNIGSAGEFLVNYETGMLTKYAPHDLSLWIKNYAETVVKLCGEYDLHKHISEETQKDIKSWGDVGDEWHEELRTLAQKT